MRVRKLLSCVQTQLALALSGALLLAGCVAMPFHFGRNPQTFPPRVVMEDGDYARFIDENHQTLEACEGKTTCAVALFNLGFAHAYPKSPYHDPAKAQGYLEELVDVYPQTAWALQGQAWLALVKQTLALQAARNQLQAVLRAQAAVISDLEGRLQRSREIDLRIDKKERELLR